MTDDPSSRERFRELEEKLHAVGLTPEEQTLWEQLRHTVQDDPITAPFPGTPGFDTWGVAPDAAETGTPAPPVPESTSVLWDRGPVLLPDSPFQEPAPVPAAPAATGTEQEAPPPFPVADPSFAAVVVPEESIPEVAAEDIEEIADESPPALPAAPAPVAAVAVAAIAWVDDSADDGPAVSLDSLGVTPPPPSAESLAPPLPPPVPEPRPAPQQPPVFPSGAPAAPRDPFVAPPSFVSGEHRVVLHTVEGQVLRGALANADLEDEEVPMIQPNGAVARIPSGHVKAIFFMLPAGERPPMAQGTRVRVTFNDGRQVSGVAPDYSPNSPGFFVLPLDARTNTGRVWVYRAAVRQISVG